MRLFLFLIYRCGSLVCSVLCIVQEEVHRSFQFYFSMCVATLSGNACETRDLADKSFHRLMLCWVWRTTVYHVVSGFPKKADGGSKISERQWVRERAWKRLKVQVAEGEKQATARENEPIDTFSSVFSDVSASAAAHSFRVNCHSLSTVPVHTIVIWSSSFFFLVLERTETALLRHSSLLGH